MAKIMEADGAVAEAYAEESFAATDDIWLRVDIYFEAAALANWQADWADIGGFRVSGVGLRGIFGIDGGGWYVANGLGGKDYAATAPAAGAWVQIDLHFDRNNVVELYIAGVLEASVVAANVAATSLQLGLIFLGNPAAGNVAYFDDVAVGTSQGASDIFADDFESGSLASWTATSGDVSVIDDPFGPPPTPADRFYEGYPWRFIVTDLDSATLTLLDRLQTDRRVVARLGAAWEHSGVVPSYSPEVNILRSGLTDDPFVQEGISLIYGFRREGNLGTGDGPWVIRYAGVLLQVEDDADTDLSLTSLRSWDPWMYLYKRPVRDPDTGNLPPSTGLVYNGPADEIVVDLIFTTIQFDGPCFIDYTLGQVDPCDTIEIPFQRGMSVGEALDAIMATQACEIMFTPIYEPVTLPGITSALNVAPELGQQRNDAIMAWDKPSRSLTGLNRRLDGTRRVNVIQAYAGQGGTPVAEFDDATSVARFGVYYEQPFIVGNTGQEEATESNALRQLSLRSYGERTYQLSPATARAPVSLLDYEPGDTVPVYASSNFRQTLAEDLRIMEIPIDIDDNAIETVSRMTMAPSPTTES